MDNNNQANRSNKKTWYRANRSLLIILLVIFVLFVLFSLPRICSYASYILAWKSPYKVVDSGIWTTSNPYPKTFWLDNNRVFFNSNEKLVPGRDAGMGAIWDTSTGKVTFPNSQVVPENIYCVKNGELFYYQQDKTTGAGKYYLGSLENPREYPPPGDGMRVDEHFDCDWVPKKAYGPVSPENDFPRRYKLRGENYVEEAEHGKFISIDRLWKRGRMFYHERNNDEGMEMPFDISGGGTNYKIFYNQFLDAYVGVNIYTGVKSKTDFYWIIERNGVLTKLSYPKAMPDQNLYGFYPVKQGYLIYGSGGKRITLSDPGDQGLFLMFSDKYEPIIRGIIRSVSISPDGCKAAFAYARNHKENISRTRPYRTLRMVHICK